MSSERAAHAAFDRDRALERRRSAVAWVAVASGVGVVGFAGLAAVTNAGASGTAASRGADPGGAPAPAAPASLGRDSLGDESDPFQGSLQPPSRLPGRSFGGPVAVSGGS